MLTEHQQQVFEEGLQILGKHDRLVIKGSAGVGKTYMVESFIRHLKSMYAGTIYATAPTNNAVEVLHEKINIPGVELMTIHSALRLRRNIDPKTGKISFRPSFSPKNAPFIGVKYLFIDESSMIPIQILLDIEEHAKRQNCKVIFIGDNKQINPVGERDSPVFLGRPRLVKDANVELQPGEILSNADDIGYVVYTPYPTIELTEIVRQKEGNPIIDLSRNLPLIKSRNSVKNDVGGYIFTEDREKIIDTLAAVNGTDELKYLAYSNAEVDAVNNNVRQRIYGNPAKIELGESLVFNAPYGEKYFTNSVVKVEDVQVVTKKFNYPVDNGGIPGKTHKEVELKCYIVNSKTVDEPVFNNPNSWDFGLMKEGQTEGIIIVHEESEELLKRVIKEMKNCASASLIGWAEQVEFAERFADIKYNHALTVHKSQGKTFKQTIVNIRSIENNPNEFERERLLYTGVTRASDLLILYKA